MGQQIVVGFIVGLAALYSTWALMPTAWRRALALRAAGALRRRGVDERRAARLLQALSAGSACSECSRCKGCGTPTAPSRVGTAVIAPPEKFAGPRQP